MRKLIEWLEQNRKLALVIGGAVALVLVVAVGWMTIVGQSKQPEAGTPQPSESTTGPDAGSGTDPDNEEAPEVGPSELPDSDVSEDVAQWEVRDLAPIEATTDPVEFAEKFSQVWMAPNYAAYDKDEFLDWVENNFSPNDASARATQSARVSILDQIVTAEDWQAQADEGTVQAAQVLSVEEPEWVTKQGSKAQRFLTEAEQAGWPNTTLVEAYAMVYTQGKLSGQEPFDSATLRREVFAIKCDPHCAVADVLSQILPDIGGEEHGKDIEDFEQVGTDG